MASATNNKAVNYVLFFLAGVLLQYILSKNLTNNESLPTSKLLTCPELICPQPVCPQPNCPQPNCPQPNCPRPICPKPFCPSCSSGGGSSSSTLNPIEIAKDMSQTCLETYHETVHYWDSKYNAGHWGISSPQYKQSKTGFVVEQVLKARENGLIIKNICELGIMAGASSLLFLLVSTPNATWYGFDKANERADRTRGAASFFKRAYPNRAFYIEGDSSIILPYNDVICDLVLIDGRKDEKRYDDIINLRKMSHPDTIVILDECGDIEYDQGKITLEQLGRKKPTWGGAEVAYNKASKDNLLIWGDCSPSVVQRDSLCVVHFAY